MEINGVEIEDTYAEAFPIKIARILITAATKRWALVAATESKNRVFKKWNRKTWEI